MVAFVRELIKHPKFFPGTQDESEKKLIYEKEKQPKIVAYCFRPSYEQPGKFVLSYRPGNSTKHENISVLPNGYRFRKNYFDSIANLLNWFKGQYGPRK